MTYFKNNMAEKFGIKSAIVAQFLWDSLYIQKNECQIAKRQGKEWCRCSAIYLTGVFPYLSRHQILDTFDNLVENKVIQKACFNSSRFDNTNWYAFTEYGKSLMIKSEEMII